ncbi:hypothetical protein BASA83_007426 [Batrachochytrium salamandrivorans]|nr:hypothetical protein BASA83_007426 [Batrachochytrium salamandrivorans]
MDSENRGFKEPNSSNNDNRVALEKTDPVNAEYATTDPSLLPESTQINVPGRILPTGINALFSRPENEDDLLSLKQKSAAALEAAELHAAQSRLTADSIVAGVTSGIDKKSKLASYSLEKKKGLHSHDILHDAPSRRRQHNVDDMRLLGSSAKSSSYISGLNNSSDAIAASLETKDKSDPVQNNKGEVVLRIDDLPSTELQILESRLKKLDLTTMKDHLMSFDQLLKKYKTKANSKRPLDSEGITNEDAASRIRELGLNVHAPPKRVPMHVKFMECLISLFNILLFFAGFMYLVLYAINPTNNFESVWIGCTLIIVAFIYAGIEFYEIQKISAILESFKLMIPTQTSVLRLGKRMITESTQLVPGDIMFLRSGDKVAADAVLFHSTDMRVDISSLTGENEPLLRFPKLEGCREGTDPLDAPNLLFSTDLVVSGEGYAVVVQTGRHSVIGKISRLTQMDKPRKSPLSFEIQRFCKTISILAGITAVVFFFVALLRGRNFTYAATFGIGILIAWVPQGLPLTVTMILAISGRRMADQKVLVKDLHAVETLGGITMLATDKTGTLTKNEMTVMEIWTNGAIFYAGPSGASSLPKGYRPLRLDASGVPQILHVCVTCSTARFEMPEKTISERAIIGDATEVGLLRFAGNKLANIDRLPELYPKVLEIPFTSDTKVHITIHRKSHPQGGLTLHMKGAPEMVWEACTTIWIDGKATKIDTVWQKKYKSALEDLTQNGSRVLGMAMLHLRGDKYPDNWTFSAEKKNFPTSGLTFLGLVGMEDPPKDGVADAILTMRTAGIKVMMITGDNPKTAEAISRKVNIFTFPTVKTISLHEDLPVKPGTGKESIVISGHMMGYLSDDDWLNILNHDEIIFARTLPADKLQIVKHSQALGHIVAVTGDGVNDSAALKKADLGIAMNRTGCDISKDSAKMILLDDNFASTVRGIQEGRLIFINLKKAIRYSLTHILPEVLPYLLYVVVPIPLALTPTQILAVDLGFEILTTMSFSWEPAEDISLLMSMPPRNPVTQQSATAMHSIMKRRCEIEHSFNPNLSQSANTADGRKSNLQLADRNMYTSNRHREGQIRQDNYHDHDVMDSTMLLNEIGVTGDADPNIEMQIKVLNKRLMNKYGGYLQETKSIFTSLEYWKMQYENWRELTASREHNERLVDSEVLIYSYLEAGLIEFSGALTTYFAVFWYTFGVSSSDARHGQIFGNLQWKPHSPSLILESGREFFGAEQFEALKQVQSVYYLSIFIIQVWNLFACKTRYTLPFRRTAFSNKHTWLSILAGGIVAGVIVYTPVTNAIFLTSINLDPIYLLIPMSFGAFLYLYSTIKMMIIRYDKLLLDLQGINVPSNEVFENTSPPKPLDIAHDAHITQGGRLPPTRDEAPPSERVSSVSDQPRTGSSWRLPYTMQRLKRSDSQPPTAGANDAQFQPEIVNQNDFQGSTPPNISILQSSKNRTRLYNISNASSFSNMPPTSPISSQLSSPLIGTRSAILISKASSHSLQPSPIAVSASLSGPTDTSTPPQSSPGTLVLNQSAGSTNSSRSDKLCAVCGLAISRGGAGLRGKFYHSEHFVCSEPSCRRNLKGVVCFERDNQLFCEKDYHVRFSPQCGYCKEPIKDNRVIEALGQTFHRAHFFCSHCGKTFGPEDTFQEYEGKAYCEEDFVMLFALKCSACHGSILEESISALGHKWHARCFTCSVRVAFTTFPPLYQLLI